MIEIDLNTTNAHQTLAKQLANKLKNAVILCIGTEKVVADSLGPRVGTLINENLSQPLFVYGLQGANIHAQNLGRATQILKRLHPDALLLVVDAAVGDQEQVGKIQLMDSNIIPGAATTKQLAGVGDIAIVGIVANKNMVDFYDNSVERSILVERLSQFVATSIIMATKMVK